MIINTISDSEHKRRYAAAIKKAGKEGQNAFQNWFNRSENVHEAVINGFWDFACHILTEKVFRNIIDPRNKIALEIGHGGGRLLNTSCLFFKRVIGLDIHNENTTIKKFLKNRGRSNFKLIRINGRQFNVTSESIDFIYSFIVLQHLPNFEVFIKYLEESYRCLKRGGIAQLYFGKFSKISLKDQLLNFLKGYKEIINAPVNHTSLVIRTGKVKQFCQKIGFKVLDTGSSYKLAYRTEKKTKGGQNYITLLKI